MSASRTLLLAFSLLASSCAHANPELAKLAWLGGCWKSETAEPGSVEQWLPLAGGTLIGVSRTVKSGKTVAHEFMQIREHTDGKLSFLAQPSGQQFAAFPLLRISESEVVFENLQHDFPQRIVYALEGGTRLNARIQGVRNGSLRVIAFPMSRVSCDSLLISQGR
jgi:hypothetical protein